MARLSGAPRGSTLYVSVTSDNLLELKVENENILAEPLVRFIVQEEEGFSFYIVNSVFRLSDASQRLGIGARSLSLELHEALSLNIFTKVKTHAVGDYDSAQGPDPLSGYLVWPLLGFDADIPTNLLSHPKFPLRLQGKTRLLDLMDTQDGVEFWEEFGSSIEVEFDLTPGSACWNRHKCYTAYRNIEVQP